MKFAAGVYRKLPSGFSVAVPWLGPLTSTAFSVPPSASVSLASTAIVTAWSSTVVAESFTATGALLTFVTVTLTVAVAEPPWPSLIV